MADYTKTVDFAAKDTLDTGEPAKVVLGAEHDEEYNNIAVAINSKYGAGNLASAAQAEAESLHTVLITPRRLGSWGDANAGMVGDLQAMSDPGVDVMLYWDDSANALQALRPNNGIGIASDDRIGLTDVSASPSLPLDLNSGAWTWDSSAITEIKMTAVSQASDGFLIDDNGTLKVLPYDQAGIKVKSKGTATLSLSDANSLLEFDNAGTITIPTHTNVEFDRGTVIILVMDHASDELTVRASSSVSLNSTNHAGGGIASSDKVSAGGMAALVKLSNNEWSLAGDIVD